MHTYTILRRPILQWSALGLAGLVLTTSMAWLAPVHAQPRSAQFSQAPDLQGKVEIFSLYLLRHWERDPKLNQAPPPQIITSISSSSTVLGGCLNLDAQTGRATDVGGTSYCPPTNTIFVVQDQLKPLMEIYGDVAVGYVLAHEFGHALQHRFKQDGETLHLELQADCLSGSILGQGSQELGITPKEVVAMTKTAYSLGDPTHGTGEQRAIAVYAGMGFGPWASELKCTVPDMVKLSKNQVSKKLFSSLKLDRSFGGSPVNLEGKGPKLRSISGSLGI